MQKLYNVIAEMVAEITGNNKEDFYKKYRARSLKKREQEMQVIQEKLPEVFEQGTRRYRALEKHSNFGEDFIIRLKELFDTEQKAGHYNLLLRTLEVLDAALERQIVRELQSAWSDGTEACLNSNWNTLKVGIVPRCECYWERKHKGSQYYSRIDNFLSNILIIDYRKLGEAHIFHHYLPVDMFGRAEQKGELTVAISPFKAARDFKIMDYERDSTSYFSIQYCGEEEKDNQRIRDIISHAAEKEVDILIFPEMLGNTKMEENIADYLQEPIWIEKGRPPSLMVLPTVWNQGTNTAYLLNRTGSVICAQNKQKSYPKPDAPEKDILEDIKEDHVIHLMHIIGIGRMVIMICKDFISEEYLRIALEALKVTFILIPSYSTGYHDFDMMAGQLLTADCCAVWVNACAAVMAESKKEKNLGYLFRCGTNRVNDTERREFFRMEKQCQRGKCKEVCLYTGKLKYAVKIEHADGEEDGSGK